MASVIRDLHRRCRFHKDLYLCHFFIAAADTQCLPQWAGRVWLIDLHRLGHHPVTRLWWRAKDLAQLLFSSDIPGVDGRDRLHFWRAYIGRGLAARCLGWLVRLRAWTYRRHNRRRMSAAPPAPRRPGAAA
jgi:heptose I phosphotransferase